MNDEKREKETWLLLLRADVCCDFLEDSMEFWRKAAEAMAE